MAEKKWVYTFAEGDVSMKQILGGKGANLADMTKIGLPVPQGFTITTEVCDYFYKNNKNYPKELQQQIDTAILWLEKQTGMKFGDSKNPLLVSVRSGAAVSMPGMMDTILNLGLNEVTLKAMIEQTKNERFCLDSYRRFMQMFGDVVMNVEHRDFEEILEKQKHTRGIQVDTELNVDDLRQIIAGYKALIKKQAGKDFPQNVKEQLMMAVNAVFGSWNNSRAITYRRLNDIKGLIGTAVNVQAMVFGNMGNDCGTGVAFTRNPSTGENKFYGEYLINAQGEDVVAGIRTPQPVAKLGEEMPAVYQQLLQIRQKLEKHYRDMQDIEFTVQKGKLYMLQTRNGKRTGHAAVKLAVDFETEKLLTKEEALMKVDPAALDQLLHKTLDPIARKKIISIARGLPASPGAAVGKIVFNAEDAKDKAEEGEKVILVRLETSPEDIEGMHVSQGILTARGGMTCVGGSSLLLTDSGFYTAEQLFNSIENGLKPKILSFDNSSMKTKWKNVIAAGRKKSEAIKINVSQSGRTEDNSLIITPTHKMMMINNRKMEKKPINAVLSDNQMVSIIDRIPSLDKFNDSDYAYLAGALFTDGNIMLNKRRGRVTFTQKAIPEKMNFINRVKDIFLNKFGIAMKERQRRLSISAFNDRKIISENCCDYMVSQKMPAQILLQTKQNLVQWALSLDESATFSFLAGLLDGDGSYANGRFHLYIGKQGLMPAVVISCLKLGIVPQITPNRQHFNVQIVERIEEIAKFTARLKPIILARKYESKLFSTRQLFNDIKEQIDFTGSIKPAIVENKMLGAEKIKEYVLNFKGIKTELKQELEAIINSDLRMYRANKKEDVGVIEVFNFEVDSSNELDKNFVVFTNKFTPVLVSNSHAAVVARGMGKCCVAGCSELVIDEKNKTLKIKDKTFKEGDFLTLDGSTGEVYPGQIPVIDPELAGEFATLMKWAREIKKLGIRTNADTPKDAKIARSFGAEGIGLTRTEHMFFEGNRITSMREMILADNEEGRRKALAKLLPFQRSDFEGIFEAMNGLPVIIRFLDPPLHEFLPKHDQVKEIQELATILKITPEKIKQRTEELHEFNPMLGFRGCRLGVVYPEISEMQARAVFEAAINAKKKGIKALPEIEIPNIISVKEFKLIKEIVERVAKELKVKEAGIKYSIGTMIEFPRAAFVADELASEAEFMSFGTNDLTQTTLGFSRDDAGRFIPSYVEKNVFDKDPFQTIDQEGVGKVMKMAISKARSVKPDMDIGICGEHGGDPASVKFCHRIGLSNVSCSPFRVPIATLAAAQAVIEAKKEAEKNKNAVNNQSKQIPKPQIKQIQKLPQAKPSNPQHMKQQMQTQPLQSNQNKNKINNIQKPNQKLKQTVSIQDEIRKIIREEISRVKG